MTKDASMLAQATLHSYQSDREAFAEARAAMGLTQKEFAERLGSSYYALVRWERGDIAAPTDVLERLRIMLSGQQPEEQQNADARKPAITFASSGVRHEERELHLFSMRPIQKLQTPREHLFEFTEQGGLWGDGSLALGDMLVKNAQPAKTRDSALNEEISAGKNTYTYDAHTYHTKVPPQGIAAVIRSYLPQGGLVLDPFAGSGMTGVAARYVGADVVLNELSPAASFIAKNFTGQIDVLEFNAAIKHVVEATADLRKQLYTTDCRECGRQTELLFTVWSYELECNHCSEPFVLWDHCRKYGNNVKEHKLLKKFPCPNCQREVNKSYLPRRESVPVFVGYKCCGPKIVEHPLTEQDRTTIAISNSMAYDLSEPLLEQALPDGVNLNQPKRHGLDSIRRFYTPRNFHACSALWRQIRIIEDEDLANAVGFVFTSLYQRVTKLSEYRFWGGSGNTANFNVPHISNESNVFVTFERKAKSIADHYATTAGVYSGRSVVRTGSATDMTFLPDNSVDFIFTDPPFGANINYSEMNILWESWLGSFTDPRDEAIVNKFQGKDVQEYTNLMSKSLREAHRVLRPDHWMVLVFMNSSERIWDALRTSVSSAGFVIEKISIFDKQHGTFKQFVSENAAGADLMLHCRKVENDRSFEKLIKEVVEFSVGSFLMLHGPQLPISPFLHVDRDPEIDYRTLYSRYIAMAMECGARVIGFSDFRATAQDWIGGRVRR
jgi:DNA modification methylase/transcriptional regulator with XRE-family HTH domain